MAGSDKDFLRCFIGIPVSEEVRDVVHRLQERLRPELRDPRAVRWERAANLHITLQFLGNTRSEIIGDIVNALTEQVVAHRSFELHLGEPSAFGRGRARVLLVHVGRGSAQVERLYDDAVQTLTPFGYEPDKRPYRPHLTIGRVRKNKKLPMAVALKHLRAHASVSDGLVMPVREVVLFQSRLSPTGATYSRLATFDLA